MQVSNFEQEIYRLKIQKITLPSWNWYIWRWQIRKQFKKTILRDAALDPKTRDQALDRKAREIANDSMVNEKGTDPKMHHMATEAWKRDRGA